MATEPTENTEYSPIISVSSVDSVDSVAIYHDFDLTRVSHRAAVVGHK
jgi:hypothetical protein